VDCIGAGFGVCLGVGSLSGLLVKMDWASNRSLIDILALTLSKSIDMVEETRTVFNVLLQRLAIGL
jgi:hypothetical protein